MARRRKPKRKQNQDAGANAVAIAAQRYQQALEEQSAAIRSGNRKRADRASAAVNEARRELETLVSSHWEITGAALGATAGGALGALTSGVGGAALGSAGGALIGGFLGSPRVREGFFSDDEDEDEDTRRPAVRASRPDRLRRGAEANPKQLRKLKNKLLK